jgi:DNA-binding transcriptional regulator LsrR (DeoR family)
MLMSDEHTASVIRTQPQVAAVLKRFADITFAVVAIGSFDPPNSQLLAALPASEQSGLVRLGVRAEFSSTLLNEAGEIVAPEFANRTIAISAKQLKAIPEVLAVAGGINKATAIRAVLRGGFLTSLVTDDGVAKLLLADRVAKESDDIDSSRRDVQRRHRKLAVIP